MLPALDDLPDLLRLKVLSSCVLPAAKTSDTLAKDSCRVQQINNKNLVYNGFIQY